ncbi:MAG: protease complex subunit PrcB family protein [Nitrospirae bacterium]|nr:protease complex subunit PrcB family protein [Candidatus Manganitrophaceae bacterium]
MSFFSVKKTTASAFRSTARPLWIVWTILLALAACAASKMDYATIDQGITSGKRASSPSVEVIGDRAAFERLVTEIHSDRLPPAPLPDIDFQQWWAVFISLGEKPSAGYRLKIAEVTRAKETVRVKIETAAPSPGDLQAAVMTAPFALIKIKKEPAVKKVALIDADNNVIGEYAVPVETPGPND